MSKVPTSSWSRCIGSAIFSDTHLTIYISSTQPLHRNHIPQRASAVVFSVPCPLEGHRPDVSKINGGILRLDASSCTPRGHHVLLPFDQVRATVSRCCRYGSPHLRVSSLPLDIQRLHDWHRVEFQGALPVPMNDSTSSLAAHENIPSDSLWVPAFWNVFRLSPVHKLMVSSHLFKY